MVSMEIYGPADIDWDRRSSEERRAAFDPLNIESLGMLEYYQTGALIGRKLGFKSVPEWYEAYESYPASGYSYSELQHLDEHTAILPGLAYVSHDTPSPMSDLSTWNYRREKWETVDTASRFYNTSNDGTKLVIGELSQLGLSYILDPATNRAVSPAFKHLIEYDNNHAIIDLSRHDERLYELRATTMLSDIANDTEWSERSNYPDTPDFLCGQHMSMTPYTKGEGAELAATTATDASAAPDIFGIVPLTSSAGAYGKEVVARVVSNVAQFASISADALRAAKQPDQPIVLRHVDSPRINTSLTLQSFPDGSVVIELSNELVITHSAHHDQVTVSAHGKRLTPHENPDYYMRIMRQIDERLQEYFDRLYQQEVQLDAKKLYTLRQKLGQGGVAGWWAKHKLQNNLR